MLALTNKGKLFLAIAILGAAGCARKTTRTPVALNPVSPAVNRYVDFQAGSRVRVVSPLAVGYEIVFYDVKPRDGGGVRIEFSSGELRNEGNVTPETRPAAPMFQFDQRIRYVRLLFLIRVSRSDHNMALLAASDEGRLNALTERVQGDPATCKVSRDEVCSWVPEAVGVLPQAGAK